jgi:hypothetical protein
MQLIAFMKIKPVSFGLALAKGFVTTMENPLRVSRFLELIAAIWKNTNTKAVLGKKALKVFCRIKPGTFGLLLKVTVSISTMENPSRFFCQTKLSNVFQSEI